MIIVDHSKRYTANQALKHPWITRNEDQISQPLGNFEIMKCFETSCKLMRVIKALAFMREHDLYRKFQVTDFINEGSYDDESWDDMDYEERKEG